MSPQERAQLAESQILADKSLTADLPDAEAQRLLNWAVIHARRLAMASAAMSDLEGDSYFGAAMPTLQRLARKISRISASLPSAFSESFLPDLRIIVELAHQLPDLLAAPPGDTKALAGELARLSPGEAVNRLTGELTLRDQARGGHAPG